MQIKDNVLHGKFLAPLEIASDSLSEDGEFEGYASVFGVVDGGNDIVARGAYAESLADGKRVRMLRDHDPAKVIGKWLEVREDDRGLWVRGKFNLDVQLARETHSLVKDGAIDGMSIGYRTQIAHKDEAGRRVLERVDLWEISVVTFPMLPDAVISSVKGEIPTEREFEQWLQRDAGFTRKQSKAIIANGYKALTGQRDAAKGDETGVKDALNQLAQLMRG